MKRDVNSQLAQAVFSKLYRSLRGAGPKLKIYDFMWRVIMKLKKHERNSVLEHSRATLALAIVFLSAVAVVSAQGQTQAVFTVLYAFNPAHYPNKLFRDTAGNLYSTSSEGGSLSHRGVVFTLDPRGKLSVLHSFKYPEGRASYAGVIRDSAGNLYGSTSSGGDYGLGTVFELNATGILTVLHSFSGGTDGGMPYSGLIRDSAGNLYGTTCGAYGYGTVYKLDVTGIHTVLYNFSGGEDGNCPYAGVIRDSAGNLYGTTLAGGSYGSGTVFKLDTTGILTVLHSFSGADGASPYAGLIRDASGNLYGTASEGGAYGAGIVFKLDTSGKETVLYNFTGGGVDGARPIGGVIGDPSGNLFGTTEQGGTLNMGTVFMLDSAGKQTVLYNFTDGLDGKWPAKDLIRDPQGNLYSTTAVAVFRLVFAP
jgi:uncharacterized repeat protein (TIGR03803 family)